MTPDRLREIIAGGESLDVEFKGERRGQVSDRDLVEAIVCLSNRPGDQPGYLLIGVEDDGSTTGARTRDPLQLQGLVASRTRPSVSCRVQPVPIDGTQILVVEVSPSLTPVGTSDGTYLRR